MSCSKDEIQMEVTVGWNSSWGVNRQSYIGIEVVEFISLRYTVVGAIVGIADCILTGIGNSYRSISGGLILRDKEVALGRARLAANEATGLSNADGVSISKHLSVGKPKAVGYSGIESAEQYHVQT